MPRVDELLEWCRSQVRNGKSAMHTNHVVIIEEEQKKRTENAPDEQGKRKTRIAWDCADPETFAEFHKERERYMKAAGSNPTMATDVIILALRLHTDEEIRKFIEAVSQVPGETFSDA